MSSLTTNKCQPSTPIQSTQDGRQTWGDWTRWSTTQCCTGALGEPRTMQEIFRIRTLDNWCITADCLGCYPLPRGSCTNMAIKVRRRKLTFPDLPQSMIGGRTILIITSRSFWVMQWLSLAQDIECCYQQEGQWPALPSQPQCGKGKSVLFHIESDPEEPVSLVQRRLETSRTLGPSVTTWK